MPEANESLAVPANCTESWIGPGGKLVRLFESRWQPIFIVAAFVLGAIALRLANQLHVPLPYCVLRQTTGIPCPGCGATRSLLGWSHLNPLESLRFNPLFFGLTLAVAVWAGTAFTDACLGTQGVKRMKEFLKPWAKTRWLLVLLTANWLYLWLTLPK